MSESLRIASAEVVRHGILHVRWSDGSEGIVDLKGMIARGGVFSFLEKDAAFGKVAVAADGRAVQWTDPYDDIISITADALYARANVMRDLAA
ncbi:hypothetical protein [Pseudoxanthobacter sp.]|uniref:hypothetical protein n=1 Tax=Pseudoxanthobacter sp. TaxID=1925742 RepID=UPI002FE3FAFA